MGLATGVTLAFLGRQVPGVDMDAAKATRLDRGELPIDEPGLPELLDEAKEHIRFAAGAGSANSEADGVFIVAGAPANPDGSPDLTYVRRVA